MDHVLEVEDNFSKQHKLLQKTENNVAQNGKVITSTVTDNFPFTLRRVTLLKQHHDRKNCLNDQYSVFTVQTSKLL